LASSPERFRELLASSNEEARREAVVELKGRTDSSVSALINEALGDESWRVRKDAVEIALALPDKASSSNMLIKALGDEYNAGRRAAAMEALSLMGPDALPYLHTNINHPDLDVRKFIIDILGLIRNDGSVEPLIPLIKHGSENIRMASVEALGLIGGDRAFDALLNLLPSEDVSLQFSLLHAIGKIGKPIPVDFIKPLMDKMILRRAIYDSLGQTKTREAVDILVDGLKISAKSAKMAAMKSLFKIDQTDALTSYVEKTVRDKLSGTTLLNFSEFLKSDNLPAKRSAVRILEIIGNAEATSVLLDASSDDSINSDVSRALKSIKQRASSETDSATTSNRPSLLSELKKMTADAAPESVKPLMLGPMTMNQFEKVRDLVSDKAGLFFETELKYLVERRIQRRMEQLALTTYDEYIDLIEKKEPEGLTEQTSLINVLSTNETYFFREDFQLKAFKDEVLPALISHKESMGDKTIRIWSAGCSSGEEPYTIAILCKESGRASGFNFEIMGSDINDKMVANAKKAVYSSSSFRTTTPEYLEKYFKAKDDKYALKDEIKKLVSFEITNLMDCSKKPGLKNLDVIFCRNVIIYFSPEAKRRVVDQFYDLLSPGGFLLLGHSESLMSISTRFQLEHLKNDLVYRKPLSGGQS
jgi:chemotaxis protein methyltransferase CheR